MGSNNLVPACSPFCLICAFSCAIISFAVSVNLFNNSSKILCLFVHAQISLSSCKPKLTAIALSTNAICFSSSLPICSRRRRLSMVRICSSRITLSRLRPTLPPAMLMWVGSRALPVWLVMAAAMTVGEWRLPVSFWTMSTGRVPPCSLPTTGLRSA